MIRNPFCTFALSTVLVLTGLTAKVQGQDEDDLFYLPDMDVEIFSGKKLDFGRRADLERTGLASALARIARDFDPTEEHGEVENELRSNALGIAGRIDPKNSLFKDTYEQLEKDAEAVGVDGVGKNRLVGNIFSGVRTLLNEEENEDNKICAAYCVDIALRLVPNHKYADRLEKIQKDLEGDGIELDWENLRGEARVPDIPGLPNQGRMQSRREKMPAGPADALTANQRSVVGLVVVNLPNGKQAGAASEIIATALKQDRTKGVEFIIDQKVGDMMGNSLKSIRDYLRVTYEPKKLVPDGYEVKIVFENRDQLVDGPSAGTAMALMLDALFSGDELDEGFACTGGITPNGKCTKIGGVAAKIRGATRRQCKIVGVPEGNAKGVNDILVLDGIQPLLDIQVFTMKDIDEARALSREKKEDSVQTTLDDFNAVVGVIADEGEKMLKNSRVQEKLEAVLEKMPNHISAQLLLDFARGKAPETLSIGGSMHEINSRSSSMMRHALMTTMRGKFQEGATVRDDAKDALEELDEIDGKVHELFEDFHKEAVTLCKLVEGGIKDGEEDFLNKLKSQVQKVQGIQKKLSENPEVVEELRG